ncbi:MAG: hypothetical protein IIA72_00175 [Proteobacteria bacterium]|nr:hypothetical protein [Pseudomonadota bacterium]
MTLFIAYLIVYQFDMSPWLYLLAAFLWVARLRVLWAVGTTLFESRFSN